MNTINVAAKELREYLIETGIDVDDCHGYLSDLAIKERECFELIKPFLTHEECEARRYNIIQLELIAFVLGRSCLL